MTLPKMTPKRWFWSAMALGLIWCACGWWDGRQVTWMAAVQNGLSQPVETAAIPPSFILSTVQGVAQNALRSLAATGDSPATSAALRERLRALENENAQLKGLLTEYIARETAMGYLRSAHIAPEDVLPATVVGYQAGAGASILRLDKGLNDGVKVNAVVLAPLEQVHLLGRVVHVGLLECEVRLVSDPLMKTQAQIIRPFVQTGTGPVLQNYAVTAELCLVRGLGNGQMLIDNVDTIAKITNQPVTPVKGDLVCLTDGSWPAKVQHMVLGQVETVGLRQDQPMRYDIRIAPRIAVSAQRTVMILIHE